MHCVLCAVCYVLCAVCCLLLAGPLSLEIPGLGVDVELNNPRFEVVFVLSIPLFEVENGVIIGFTIELL